MKKEKNHNDPSQLIVGGHSFIPELGNDPPTDFDTQLAIVNECLDQGINCFDATYEPERIALGGILEALGRRSEAQIIAWNFFTDNCTGEYLVGPQPFEKDHIEQMLGQLRTDYIDMLVVHPVKDGTKNKKQIEIAQSWVSSEHVGMLGTWAPGNDPAKQFGLQNPYDFAVMPRNIRNPNTNTFLSCKAIGWQTFATSPFNRGWLLDQMFLMDSEQTSEEPETVRARIANALLRFSIHDPQVDRLIVGFRKKEWISRNLESLSMGPLSKEEQRWLFKLLERAETAEQA